jgi:hypothetical protein
MTVAEDVKNLLTEVLCPCQALVSRYRGLYIVELLYAKNRKNGRAQKML